MAKTDEIPADPLKLMLEAAEQSAPPPILSPLPSIEQARAVRMREGPPEGKWGYIARAVEAARSADSDDERAEAATYVAEWLAKRWRVPLGLRGALAEYAAANRRRISMAQAKVELLAESVYRSLGEDDIAVPVSLGKRKTTLHDADGQLVDQSYLNLGMIYGSDPDSQQFTDKHGREIVQLLKGLWAPGAFGWWDLYREWFINRTRWHADRLLEVIATERTSRDAGVEEPEPPDHDWTKDSSRTGPEDEIDRAAWLERLLASLPDKRTLVLIRALDPALQPLAAQVAARSRGTKPLLLAKQRRVFLALLKHGMNRKETARALKMSRTSVDHMINRIVPRLIGAGLAAKGP